MAKKTQNDSSAVDSSVNLVKLFPSVITIIGLCLGLSAIRFALYDQWHEAAAFIVFAALVDAVDGRIARMMNACSEFGAQLDSLSDFVNFGVAPAMILYLWQGQNIKGLDWAVTLFFAICVAIRLARFNTELGDANLPGWSDRFFIGIPAPAGAMLALAPMGIDFAFKTESPALYEFLSFTQTPLFVYAYAAMIGALMASRLPTFSFKTIRIKKRYASLALIGVTLLIIAAFVEPWYTILGVGIWYISTIPLSLLKFYITSRKESKL